MSREIEYKVRYRGKMYDHVTIESKPDFTKVIIHRGYTEGDIYTDLTRVKLLQFTGLKDKNGTKIFEGDVVKRDDGSKGKYRRFAVVQISPDISFNCSRIKEVDGVKNSSSHTFHFGSFIYTDTHNHLETIGNLYEHPSLLTDKE